MPVFQASHYPELTVVQPLVFAVEAIRTDSNDNETVIAIHEGMTYPSYLPQPTTEASNLHLAQSNLFTTIPMTQAAGSQAMSILALSQTSADINPPAKPLQDSEGRMICDRDGCDNVTFQRRSAWE